MASTPVETMPLMSEIAFCTLPWPSAYSNLVTLGHFLASSLPDAVVTRRQLFPPKPSSSAKEISFFPHQDGAPSTWVTLPPAPFPEPPDEPPHAARTRDMAVSSPTLASLVRGFICLSSS